MMISYKNYSGIENGDNWTDFSVI